MVTRTRDEPSNSRREELHREGSARIMSDGLYRVSTSNIMNNAVVNENRNNSTTYIKDDDICIEEEGVQQQQQQINYDNCNDDAAALLVMLYLLFISTLLVGAIVMGVFVVVQYGLVVLIAVCTAAGGLLVVGATVYSVITHDAKLNKARSKIKRWHVRVKDEILKEIDNLKDDLAAYTSGTLMLTYYDGADNTETEDEIRNDNGDEHYTNGATTDEFDNKQKQEAPSTTQKKAHKPKSMLFRAFATFAKPSRKVGTDSSQKKKKKSSPFIPSPKREDIGGRNQKKKKSMRLFGKTKNKRGNSQVEASNYEPPNLV